MITRLLINDRSITWNYEKFRATFEFWQAGFICESNIENINQKLRDFYRFEKHLLDLLNEENLEITEE